MPSWEFRIAWERMIRYQAARDLRALDIATFTEWSGEMPKPKLKTSEDHARHRAHEEGNAARKEFRAGLARLARGEWQRPEDSAELTQNADGEWVDGRGRIHAQNAAHIKQILRRVAGMRL